jgi:LysM repeat protein
MNKYPWQSPYVAFNNKPITLTDRRGDDPPEETKKHTIEEGETLSEIAEETGTTVEDLMKWNESTIKDKDEIYAGDEIYVSNPERWIGVSNGMWNDTENPEERWIKQDGEWVDINEQTFGERFEEAYNKPVGHVDDVTGEKTILKNTKSGEIMMEISPEMIKWGLGTFMNTKQSLVESAVENEYKDKLDSKKDQKEKK